MSKAQSAAAAPCAGQEETGVELVEADKRLYNVSGESFHGSL